MNFTDIAFAVLLPVVFVLYWMLRSHLKRQNVLLLAVSYLFYGWWDWRFLALIIATTVSTYATALLAVRRHGKLWTALNITFNLLILVTFKYFNFFSENLQRLIGLFGWSMDWFTIDILLPVGISFYTFQAIGYSVDVYRRQLAPCRSPLDFSVFIAYFPQLVAGPIEKASALLPQICSPRRWDYPLAVSGMRMIMWGLLKKLCIANPIGERVDFYYNGLEMGYTDLGAYIWLTMSIGFTIQIYCDFSAYSEIARGVSRLFGIELMRNFDNPYFSRNPREFWQRWHVSLGRWLRDYIYIPLGGSRCPRKRWYFNLLAVFVISGLWHGASWNFVCWGLYWGVLSLVWAHFSRRHYAGQAQLSDLWRIMFMLVIISVSRVFYRTPTLALVPEVLRHTVPWVTAAVCALGCALWLLHRLPGRVRTACVWGATGTVCLLAVLKFTLFAAVMRQYPYILMAIVLWTEWRGRYGDYTLQRMPSRQWMRVAVYWLCILLICTAPSINRDFIYFRF